MNYDKLYLQAQKEQVPFYKWHDWIIASIHSSQTHRYKPRASQKIAHKVKTKA